MRDQFDVVIVGAGAAGLAAALRLAGQPLSVAVLEARDRRGGRAHTIESPVGPIDLGCGWLHSADENPLVPLIAQAGLAIDSSRPAWAKPALNRDFPPEDQQAFNEAFTAFDQRVAAAAHTGIDRPTSDLFEPNGRWNPMLDAVSTYYNGAEFSEVSILDYDAYEDSGLNWRVRDGYGAAILALAASTPVITGCEVLRLHRGRELRLDTSQGTITARAVILAVPTPVLPRLIADLPEKLEAAAGLPLGLADKIFFQLVDPAALPEDEQMFGKIGVTETASYTLRPLGRPYIEGFLGGAHARALGQTGEAAQIDFALGELTALLGSDFRSKLTPIAATRWAQDPYALGSYSHALPGSAGCRAVLAAPVENRIFFAGEATSPSFYSTAHGAWESGVRAADEALAALGL